MTYIINSIYILSIHIAYQPTYRRLVPISYRWRLVGINRMEVVFQCSQQARYQQPFLSARQRALLLTDEVTYYDVSLIQGYDVAFLIRLCVCLPTWATQSSRTVACAMPSMPSLSMAINDGVNLNCFILLLNNVYFVPDMSVTFCLQRYGIFLNFVLSGRHLIEYLLNFNQNDYKQTSQNNIVSYSDFLINLTLLSSIIRL